jgi:hypothetical protein
MTSGNGETGRRRTKDARKGKEGEETSNSHIRRMKEQHEWERKQKKDKDPGEEKRGRRRQQILISPQFLTLTL